MVWWRLPRPNSGGIRDGLSDICQGKTLLFQNLGDITVPM